jgi:hypothetical protein
MDYDDFELVESDGSPYESLSSGSDGAIPLLSPPSFRTLPAEQVVQATVVAMPPTPAKSHKAGVKRKQPLLKPTPDKLTPAKKSKSREIASKPSPSSAKPDRATWTTQALELLIETRWSETGKAKFYGCRTNNEKSEFWSWLTMRFNIRANTSFEVRQIKNRIDALKTEFKQVVGASKATGNPVAVKYPAYWDSLHAHLKVYHFRMLFSNV